MNFVDYEFLVYACMSIRSSLSFLFSPSLSPSLSLIAYIYIYIYILTLAHKDLAFLFLFFCVDKRDVAAVVVGSLRIVQSLVLHWQKLRTVLNCLQTQLLNLVRQWQKLNKKAKYNSICKIHIIYIYIYIKRRWVGNDSIWEYIRGFV